MGKRGWLSFALLMLLSASIASGCGSPTAEERLAQWASKWADDVARNSRQPNKFEVPKPPKVELPSVANEIGNDVHRSANDFSEEVGVGLEQTKAVFCTWFDWYLETGNTIPSEADFGPLLLEHGFGLALNGPPPRAFEEAVNRFRAAIERAQGEAETIRNAAAAAVCSIPESS